MLKDVRVLTSISLTAKYDCCMRKIAELKSDNPDTTRIQMHMHEGAHGIGEVRSMALQQVLGSKPDRTDITHDLMKKTAQHKQVRNWLIECDEVQPKMPSAEVVAFFVITTKIWLRALISPLFNLRKVNKETEVKSVSLSPKPIIILNT